MELYYDLFECVANITFESGFKALFLGAIDSPTFERVIKHVTVTTVDEEGSLHFRINGKRHRKDGPATLYSSGTKYWCQNDELYRLYDLPTIEWYEGTNQWHKGRKLHRIGGPADVFPDGTNSWYKDGKLHRENDLPAIEYANGDKHWYKDGKRHRVGGPAVEGVDEYKMWYKNGQKHREDGPAIECADGDKWWYKNGYLASKRRPCD